MFWTIGYAHKTKEKKKGGQHISWSWLRTFYFFFSSQANCFMEKGIFLFLIALSRYAQKLNDFEVFLTKSFHKELKNNKSQFFIGNGVQLR